MRNFRSVMEGLLRLFCLPSTGIAALFFVSVLFVTNMLKPIKESQEKQSRFIAAASHELRSPLSVICANNSAIASVTNDSQKFIEGIDKECKRMGRLINDMLILASADAKSWEIKKEPVETDTLLIETYEAFLPLCLQKDHSLSLELPEEALPAIISDKERLKQVLLILLDNALAYSPNNKDIILRSYTNNHFLYLEVQDHGVGIADKDKKLIFDRFYRLDPSRNEKQHFGLGLSIAKEIIQLLGGKLTVRDTEGGGATFSIRIHIPS